MKFVTDLSKGILGRPDPTELWEDIISYIPDEVLLKDDVKILCVACGHGTEATVLGNRMHQLGKSAQEINDSIYLLDKYKVFTNALRKAGWKNVITEDFLSWETEMKFDVVVGNPPYSKIEGKTKVSIGTTLIKKFYSELVKDDGVLAIVSNTNCFGGGQKGLGYLFFENEVINLQLNHNAAFPSVTIDIGSFVIKKTKPRTNIINVHNNGSSFRLDTSAFIYNHTNPYIPKNVTAETLPVLLKIMSYNKDKFDFRASTSKGATHKVGFWAGANTGIHAKYLKITNTGEFVGEKGIDHPCRLDRQYPEANIKSVFAGRLFHFVIAMVNGNQADRRPANLSHFPVVDLSTKWTFDTLSNLFNLTDKEKQIVNDWATNNKAATHWED